MSEGGLFSWKVQKVKNTPGPSADYSAMSLPPPPPGRTWHQDPQTKEYKLVAAKKEVSAPHILQQVPSASTEATGGGKGLIVDFEQQGDASERSDDWDLLSDHISKGTQHSSSNHTFNNEPVFVPKAGSVRSINTLENESHSRNHSRGGSFKIQRTHSNSTIDSTDQQDLGPSGKGVLGVDYVEHVILPTDTLQGICLAYKVSSTRLRQANHFSGHSLLLAPKKLVIPISKKALQSGFIRVQDTDAKEYKIYSFLAEFPKLAMTEAKAYLELADWDLKAAIQSCKEDVDWEQEMDGSVGTNLKAGEIRITSTMNGSIKTQGAGIFRGSSKDTSNESGSKITTIISQDEDDEKEPKSPTSRKQQSIVYASLPTIATKTVQLQDVVNAAPQHANYGVELKPISVTYKAT